MEKSGWHTKRCLDSRSNECYSEEAEEEGYLLPTIARKTFFFIYAEANWEATESEEATIRG